MEIVTLSMTKLGHNQVLTFSQDLSYCSNIKQLRIEAKILTFLTENKLCECIEKVDKIQLIGAMLSKSQNRMIRINFPKSHAKVLI